MENAAKVAHILKEEEVAASYILTKDGRWRLVVSRRRAYLKEKRKE